MTRKAKLHVRILQENCDAESYEEIVKSALPTGASVRQLAVAMPGAKEWSPDTPNLYRCRVSMEGNTLQWDSVNMEITNHEAANKSRFMRRISPRDSLNWY